MAIIGMDIHRAFAEVVALEGKSRRRLGRIAMRCDRLAASWKQPGPRRGLLVRCGHSSYASDRVAASTSLQSPPRENSLYLSGTF